MVCKPIREASCQVLTINSELKFKPVLVCIKVVILDQKLTWQPSTSLQVCPANFLHVTAFAIPPSSLIHSPSKTVHRKSYFYPCVATNHNSISVVFLNPTQYEDLCINIYTRTSIPLPAFQLLPNFVSVHTILHISTPRACLFFYLSFGNISGWPFAIVVD